jgi:hypothetical protein
MLVATNRKNFLVDQCAGVRADNARRTRSFGQEFCLAAHETGTRAARHRILPQQDEHASPWLT